MNTQYTTTHKIRWDGYEGDYKEFWVVTDKSREEFEALLRKLKKDFITKAIEDDEPTLYPQDFMDFLEIELPKHDCVITDVNKNIVYFIDYNRQDITIERRIKHYEWEDIGDD